MNSDNLLKTEGIVIQSTPYGEYDKILTLFTPQQGLLKLFVKTTQKTRFHQLPSTIPFAKAEFFYSTTRALPKLHEATLLISHHNLRNSLECLEVAAKCNHALLRSQSQGKAAPKLYTLFSHYLEKLTLSPAILYASFLLKILKHDGLLQKEKSCSLCKIPLQEIWRFGGECFCKKHALQGALNFSQDEEKNLFFLAESRSLADITSFTFEESFTSKIAILFEAAMQH